jgi:hypothetical protein
VRSYKRLEAFAMALARQLDTQAQK